MSPPDSRQVFTSYSGLDAVNAPVVRPESISSLVGALKAAAQRKEPIAFHASGGSFHDQALASGPLLVLDKMPRDVNLTGGTLEASAGATYGEANRAALARGCVVPSSPTSARLTMGGGLVTNSVSRFSPVVGKAADSIESFELLSPDGGWRVIRRPSRDTTPENDALFRAVPGSFGYLGYVSGLRARLLPLASDVAGTEPRVETTITPTTEFGPLIDALVADHLAVNADPTRSASVNLGQAVADGIGTWALVNQEGLGGVFRSRYVPGDRELRPFFLHSPDGFMHQLGEFASIFRIWSHLAWNLVWRFIMRQPSRMYVDTFNGFTFMMDGNWRARERLRRAGISPWLLQQSYLLPIHRGEPDAGSAAKEFLESSRRALHDARIRIDCIDLLTLPADDYLLSASRGREGVLISLACQGLSRGTATAYARVLELLARRCAELGGRVNLVKNVFIEPDVMREMYGDALDEFFELKSRLDPQGMLQNGFLDRILRPGAAGSGRRADEPSVSLGAAGDRAA